MPDPCDYSIVIPTRTSADVALWVPPVWVNPPPCEVVLDVLGPRKGIRASARMTSPAARALGRALCGAADRAERQNAEEG